jgi:hypothetical protein
MHDKLFMFPPELKESKTHLKKFEYEDLVKGLKDGKFKKIAVLSGP